MTIYKLNT